MLDNYQVEFKQKPMRFIIPTLWYFFLFSLVHQQVRECFNHPPFNLKGNTAPINNHASIDYCQILCKLRHLFGVLEPLIANNRLNLGQRGKCEIRMLIKHYFLRENTLLKLGISLFNTMRNKHHQFQCINSGLLNFVEISQAREMQNILDT